MNVIQLLVVFIVVTLLSQPILTTIRRMRTARKTKSSFAATFVSSR
jgi:hypothetical protein